MDVIVAMNKYTYNTLQTMYDELVGKVERNENVSKMDLILGKYVGHAMDFIDYFRSSDKSFDLDKHKMPDELFKGVLTIYLSDKGKLSQYERKNRTLKKAAAFETFNLYNMLYDVFEEGGCEKPKLDCRSSSLILRVVSHKLNREIRFNPFNELRDSFDLDFQFGDDFILGDISGYGSKVSKKIIEKL